MIQKEWDMQSLSDVLLQSVRRYGIKEVSMRQYEVVCKKIVHFSSAHGFSTYYPGLKADFDAFIDAKVNDKSICYEYSRFQHRVIRMMVSLVETDFSGCFNPPGKYAVSSKSKELIEKVLDYHSLRNESRTEMSIVMRHFLKYAEDKAGTDKLVVTDDLLMDFFTKELPKTNKRSMGRPLRATKYLSVYLKNNGSRTWFFEYDGGQYNRKWMTAQFGQAQKRLGEKEGSVFKNDIAFKYADNEAVLKKLAELK